MRRQVRTARPERSSVATLNDAYNLCATITSHYSKSFFLATSFLPLEKQRAVRALYAFCRTSDDIVDVPEAHASFSFDGWARYAFASPTEPLPDPVLWAWNDTRQRYSLSPDVVEALLVGIRMDLTLNRYETFEALRVYCYGVASTVGLLAMQIMGHSEGAEPYAIEMGIALQLTNILRDVGEDAQRDRIYLPLDEMARFGVSEADILSGTINESYRRLMRFQIRRAESLYRRAWVGIGLLSTDSRVAVASACAIYRAILPAIERNGYDNFRRRAAVPTLRKMMMLPRILWQSLAL